MKLPKISLEQWIVLQTVVDEGSFAKASEKLYRSQSTISYTIGKLHQQLGIPILEIKGRKAVLTEFGKQLLNRSRQLTNIAYEIEQSAFVKHQGWEEVLTFMVDGIFPRSLLYQILKEFNQCNRHTTLRIKEGVLSGPTQAILEKTADLVITTKTPERTVGYKIFDVESLPFAHPSSRLHQLNRKLTLDDLKTERHILVMDSGTKEQRSEGWQDALLQWKVDSMDLKASLLAQGIGFSWLPKHMVEDNQLPLKQLPFENNVSRIYPLYLVPSETIGPSLQQLIDITTAICEPPPLT